MIKNKEIITVAIIYNEPTVLDADERKFISELSLNVSLQNSDITKLGYAVDLSEVGVVDEMRDIEKALQASGFNTILFNVNSNIERLFKFLQNEKPDVIFNLCESIGTESMHEMHVAGVYELLKISYTGASAFTLGLAQQKARVKELLLYHNLPTPKFQIVETTPFQLDKNLNFPLIIKPSREDASVGISNNSVVYNFENLNRQVEYILTIFKQPALIEEYIDGRELNAAILGNNPPVVLPISEVDMSQLPENYHRIITYNAKWMKGTDEYEFTKGVCPAPIPDTIAKEISELALKAYKIIGCRDYARVDFRLDKNSRPHILEVNPNPDIAADAGFARSAKTAGYTFEEMIKKIVELALERCPN